MLAPGEDGISPLPEALHSSNSTQEAARMRLTVLLPFGLPRSVVQVVSFSEFQGCLHVVCPEFLAQDSHEDILAEERN